MSSRKGRCRIAAGSQPRRKQVSLGLSAHRGRATASPIISILIPGPGGSCPCSPGCRLALVCFEDQQSRCGWFISNPGERWLSLLRVGLTRVVVSLIRPGPNWGLWPQLCPQETTHLVACGASRRHCPWPPFHVDEPVACLVLSRQWLHVQPDEEGGQRRPLRHGPVGGPHHHHALLPEGAAVLPRLDVRPARQDKPRHQNLDGNANSPPGHSWCGCF